MEPINFEGVNVTFAKDQPEYLPLPAYRSSDGEVICCWKASLWERIKMLFTGRIWIGILTFNQKLQPILVSADKLIEYQQEQQEGVKDG